MFAKNSRYERVADAVHKDAAGREIVYKRLRLVPASVVFQTYKVALGDRLDVVAFRVYQDPEQFWRICDANRAMLPEELVEEAGRVLAIPAPQR